jgi:hypothetical protein
MPIVQEALAMATDEIQPYKLITITMDAYNNIQLEAALYERHRIVAWLNKSADQILGNALSGNFDEKICEAAAGVIEMAACDIEDGEHLK